MGLSLWMLKVERSGLDAHGYGKRFIGAVPGEKLTATQHSDWIFESSALLSFRCIWASDPLSISTRPSVHALTKAKERFFILFSTWRKSASRGRRFPVVRSRP